MGSGETNGYAQGDAWKHPADRLRPGEAAPNRITESDFTGCLAKGAEQIEEFSAADLLAADLPEPRWAVEGVLPEGLNLLAGKPKLGKSWLALNIGIAVATGGTV